MTSETETVVVTLQSTQDGQKSSYTYKGQLFRKQQTIYIRYVEQQDDEEEVRTIVRYKLGELSIVRRGAIHSEQLFNTKMPCAGIYQTPYMTMQLETRTKRLATVPELAQLGPLELAQLPFSIEWHYDLWMNEQLAGKFQMQLHIRKDV